MPSEHCSMEVWYENPVHSWTIRQIKFLLEIGISIMAGMLGM